MIETYIIALTLYLEFGGEPINALWAGASVIYNRSIERGQTYRQVILDHEQFSCWNKGTESWRAMKRKKVQTIKEDYEYYLHCRAIAKKMMNEDFKPTTNANHYFNPRYADPPWRSKLTEKRIYGNQVFGRLEQTRKGGVRE